MQALLSTAPARTQSRQATGSPMLRRLLRFNPEFDLHRAGAVGREDIEHYIADVFDSTYGAAVSEFAPLLMSMSCAGSISAAAGIRPAASGPLFLEHYLDAPVEQVLGQCYGQTILRREIFELGNLAAVRPGVCQLIYLIMAGVLSRAGFRYAVFAGTGQVIKGVGRLGFEMQTITAADPARLGAAAANWGTYYASAPQVTAIDLDKSMQHLRDQPLAGVLLNLYAADIEALAAQVMSAYSCVIKRDSSC